MDLMSLFVLLGIGLGIAAVAALDNSSDEDAEESDEGVTLTGTEGDDLLRGGPGDDRLFGAGGDDILLGGPGDDALFGGDGDDELHGGPGDDLLRGGAGSDALVALEGSDTLQGDTGPDLLVALDGPDRLGAPDQLFGGFGADTLIGDDGDAMEGGPGTDSFAVALWGPDVPAAPVIIRDLDPETEPLVLVLEEGAYPDVTAEDVEFEVDDEAMEVHVRLLGSTVAILEGTTEVPAEVEVVHEPLTAQLMALRAREELLATGAV